MSNLLYLGFAVVLSALGILWIYLRNRKPTSLNAGIEEFQREVRALAPERRPEGGSRPESRGGPGGNAGTGSK
jgi:hypothetical protein